jgi:hypothetical protein
LEIILFGLFATFGVFGLLALVSSLDGQPHDYRLTGTTVGTRRAPRFFEEPIGEVMVDWGVGTGQPHMEHMVLRIDMACHLPLLTLHPNQALLGGSGFEDRFVVHKSADGGQRLLTDEVRRRLLALSLRRETWQGLVSLYLVGTRAGSRLTILKEGHVSSTAEIEQLRDALHGIAEQMLAYWDRPWHQLCANWCPGGFGHTDDGLRRAVMEVDGLRLLVQERVTKDRVDTWLTIPLPGLGDLRIAHLEQAQAEGWADERQPTGNPVLDMLVAAQDDGGPARVRALADEPLTQALLPVIHGRRGSIGPEGLVLCLEGCPRDLRASTREMLELGQALHDRLIP